MIRLCYVAFCLFGSITLVKVCHKLDTEIVVQICLKIERIPENTLNSRFRVLFTIILCYRVSAHEHICDHCAVMGHRRRSLCAHRCISI